MKIWSSYGSEHSANLVIIGKFKTEEKAEEALKFLNDLTEISSEDEKNGFLTEGVTPTKFSDRIMAHGSKTNFQSFNYSDPKQLLNSYDIEKDGNNLILTTNELEIQAFIKIFLNSEAKIEIYSAHEHESKYGRQTYKKENDK
jgi:hypothetical protein